MKILAIIFAVLPLSLVFAAPQSSDLLAQICKPGFVKDKECTQPKNYPSNDVSEICSVTFSNIYEARVLSASSTLVIADYDSPCEPHSNNWGGAAYFVSQGGKYMFAGFQPGVRYSECLVVPQHSGKDRMVCQTGYMGQGVVESTISEMQFAMSYGGEVSAQYNVLVSASSNEGAIGVESIDCPVKDVPHKIGLNLPSQVPSGSMVRVEVDYVDESVAKKACSHPFSIKDVANYRGRSGMAPLPSVQKGVFLLNLDSQELKAEPK